MRQTTVGHLVNTTSAQPAVADTTGKKIINGISIVLPLLAAAHGDYTVAGDDSPSIGDNISSLMSHCKRLIDGVRAEAESRGIEISGHDEAVVNAACLNAVLVSAEQILNSDAAEDLTGSILNVLTALDVAKTRGVPTGDTEGMPLTMAAAMESAAAVAIFVSSRTNMEYSQHANSVNAILNYIETARIESETILRVNRLANPADIDKVNAVIAREITRVFLAVAEHEQRTMGDNFVLLNAMARAHLLAQAFVRGINNVSASISGDSE